MIKSVKKLISLAGLTAVLSGCAEDKINLSNPYFDRVIEKGEIVGYKYKPMPEYSSSRVFFDPKIGLFYNEDRFSKNSILYTSRDNPYEGFHLGTRERIAIFKEFHKAYIYPLGDLGDFFDEGLRAYDEVPDQLEKEFRYFFYDLHQYLINPPEDSNVAPAISPAYAPIARKLTKIDWKLNARINYQPDSSIFKGKYDHKLKTALRLSFENLRIEVQFTHRTDKDGNRLAFISYRKTF